MSSHDQARSPSAAADLSLDLYLSIIPCLTVSLPLRIPLADAVERRVSADSVNATPRSRPCQ